ncbi:hypothetical protein EKO04_000408 [Ascochyta lentis]|uniref:Uncharacterized protein n=1 Tax=Ascochyta lentis TaxID=205686 RepID=A0A8H7MMZ0_9PLEO|nr:hypothetical protein EKO04_000408 [Ascochyta lentis]
MVKISPWRAFKLLLTLFFCLLFVLPTLWLALPFHTVSVEERSTYIQNTLASGQTAVAAWDVKPFAKANEDDLDEGWCSECTSVLFHWRFARMYNKVHILLAPHHSHSEDKDFDLSGNFKSAEEWNQDGVIGSNKSWSPYFIDLWWTPTTVPGARQDERISQGWFYEVDRHLIQHAFVGWSTKIDVRAVIPEPGVVEFWRGTAIDRAFNHISDEWAETYNKSDVFQDRTRTPEIYKQMRRFERDIDLIASFEASENADVQDIVVKELKGDLPSRTWPVRKALLAWVPRFIVGPVMLFKAADDFIAPRFAGFLVALFTLPLIYIGVVGCCWISAGGPNIFRWISGFWMTKLLVPRRWRKAPETQHLWGPSGPVDPIFERRKLVR